MKRIIALTFVLVLSITSAASAGIRISEIAWMGTSDSSFGEWFELYNDSGEDVSLAGWKLYEDGGAQLVYTFTKIVPGTSYWVVERTTASSPDPLPSVNDEAGSFGGSGFANTGEHLVLKDAQGTVVDTLSFLSGWPAGDAETKKTMQWDRTKWVTATATPKAETLLGDTGSGGVAAPTAVTVSAPPKIEPRIVLDIPQTIYTTLSYEYSAKTYIESGEVYHGRFLWNMGDGSVYKTTTPEIAHHTYQYPGVYMITFAYYKSYFDKKPFLMSSIEKTVMSPRVLFSVVKGKGFEFTNTDTVPVDISGWVIALSDRTVELPPLTSIGSKQTVLMPFSVFGLSDTLYTDARLETPDRVAVVAPIIAAASATPSPANRARTVLSRAISEDGLATVTPSIANADTIVSAGGTDEPEAKRSTRIIIFGGALLGSIGLFIALERLMRRSELPMD